jgi:hypothetical protein
MFRALVVLAFLVFPPLLFVAYCRSLLARASATEVSEAALKAMVTQDGVTSSEDFRSLRALVRLCPMGQKDGASLAAVSAYYFLLTRLYGIFSGVSGSIIERAERERRRCSHFVAVRLDQRIANARKLWTEQMIHHGE